MKRFTIDRIEGAKVILECENEDFVSLDAEALPKGIKEGDVLMFENGSYYLDEFETQKRKEKIKNLMKSLLE